MTAVVMNYHSTLQLLLPLHSLVSLAYCFDVAMQLSSLLNQAAATKNTSD